MDLLCLARKILEEDLITPNECMKLKMEDYIYFNLLNISSQKNLWENDKNRDWLKKATEKNGEKLRYLRWILERQPS